MKLILDTDVNVNYIQTLCMIFFPGAKFALDEVVTRDTPVVTVRTKAGEEDIFAFAEIRIGEQAEDTRARYIPAGKTKQARSWTRPPCWSAARRSVITGSAL